MQPSDRYRADIDANLINFDEAQLQVIGHFDRLHAALIDICRVESFSWRHLISQFICSSNAQRQFLKGLYIWGGVGRGKTYLMDLFFDCLPTARKHRTHFYRFMQEVHQSLAVYQGEADPLEFVAASIASDVDVLCFDEFFVVDIGDAMILAGLLDALLSSGVVLVATSNVKPDALYENGLQRERFLPAIALLKKFTDIVEIQQGTDYRLQHLSSSELYHSPVNELVNEKLKACFHDLVPDQSQIHEQQALMILGREIQSVASAEDIVWFQFSALCEGPRSAFDYVELARLYHAVILSDVPQLSESDSDAARRFVSLIDELYDRRVKLVISAEVSVSDLYVGTGLEFERTRSRLMEMQSLDYLSRGHRI